MYSDDNEIWQDFVAELTELLEKIEADCFSLDGALEVTEIIHSLFRFFHSIKGLAGFVGQAGIQQIAHETEALLDVYRKSGCALIRPHVDLLLASVDLIKRILQGSIEASTLECHVTRLQGAQAQAYARDKKVEQAAEEIAVTAQARVEHRAPVEHPRGEDNQTGDTFYMRVAAHKVDAMVDMMGELLILQAVLEQEGLKVWDNNTPFFQSFSRMAKLSKAMQEMTLSMRMVSLKATFQRLSRAIRDSAAQLGKTVKVKYSGEETEIDRQVADKLLEPLLHLVRNAVSHGIESEAERLARGKEACGTIELSAFSKRGRVYIEVCDDGKGISTERVLEKALSKGVAVSGHTYSEREILGFIFVPGLSTQETVNSIAGRGVGMDAVKTEVTRLGGKVEVGSVEGQGCTFTLVIPVNLAIINGTTVDIGGNLYIVPTPYIKRIYRPEPQQWITVHGEVTAVRFRDEVIPLIAVAEALGLGDLLSLSLVVVFEIEGLVRALPVSAVRDRRDVVVKPLSEELGNLEYFNGASILGNGQVCLIFDVESLMRTGGETRASTGR